MGCGCGGGTKAAMKGVQKYTIEGDPNGTEYLTEREALAAKSVQGLTGDVVPVQ
jgi:hypothetical protein